MSHELYDIRKGLLGRWIIVHPQDEGVAWSGSRWVAHYKGVAISHVQVANFADPAELHAYALEHIDKLRDATRQVTIEATIEKDKESTQQ